MFGQFLHCFYIVVSKCVTACEFFYEVVYVLACLAIIDSDAIENLFNGLAFFDNVDNIFFKVVVVEYVFVDIIDVYAVYPDKTAVFVKRS